MRFNSEIITSRNNPTVKWAASLKEKKGRDREAMFIAEGEKLTYEALEANLPVLKIFVSEGKSEKILAKLEALHKRGLGTDCDVTVLADGVFEKISTENAPQGVISVIKHLDFFRQMDIIYKEDFSKLDNERAIALCSVRDPGNLGAVIRSSVAFGVDRILLTKDCADVYNPKTVRSAMGTLFNVKIDIVSDFASLIKAAKDAGRRVFAAELTDNAIPLSEASARSTDIFIIGNEGHGIPKEISELCTSSVYIPISKNTESLNASVAAAIFMWEQSK